MFRLTENVPQVYVEQSRDFQLLCRLRDSIDNAVKFDILSMIDILDSMKIKDTMLPLLATKMGFFSKKLKDIDSKTLRYILSAFCIAVQHKGSRLGIEYAVNAVLKAENINASGSTPIAEVIIDNVNYDVTILTSTELYNKTALDEFLKYVLPIGYTYHVLPGEKQQVGNTVSTKNSGTMMTVLVSKTSAVYTPLQNNVSISDDIQSEDVLSLGGDIEDNAVLADDYEQQAIHGFGRNPINQFDLTQIVDDKNYSPNHNIDDLITTTEMTKE